MPRGSTTVLAAGVVIAIADVNNGHAPVLTRAGCVLSCHWPKIGELPARSTAALPPLYRNDTGHLKMINQVISYSLCCDDTMYARGRVQWLRMRAKLDHYKFVVDIDIDILSVYTERYQPAGFVFRTRV